MPHLCNRNPILPNPVFFFKRKCDGIAAAYAVLLSMWYRH